jgi:hypothetical protein
MWSISWRALTAGIVTEAGTRLKGIASRVQYRAEPYESFTVRSRRPSGAATELVKRLEALRAPDGHSVVPLYTVHAWVERRRAGSALLVLMVQTQDLFEFIERYREKLERRSNPDRRSSSSFGPTICVRQGMR